MTKSGIWSYATMTYPLHINGESRPFPFTVRAVGGDTFEKCKDRLITQACIAVKEIREWADPLIEPYLETGRSTRELEKYGEWVRGVLRSANLEHSSIP